MSNGDAKIREGMRMGIEIKWSEMGWGWGCMYTGIIDDGFKISGNRCKWR